MNSFNYFREIMDTINYGIDEMMSSLFPDYINREKAQEKINEMNNPLDKGPSIDRKAIESDWKKIVNS